MFPPEVLPPGVYVTLDESEVTAPLSISGMFRAVLVILPSWESDRFDFHLLLCRMVPVLLRRSMGHVRTSRY